MAEYSLQLPLRAEDVQMLRAGDTAFLTGEIYTGRDAAHKRLAALLDAGQPLPIDLKGQTIYYVGPAPAAPGHAVGSAGPTTSGRMDKFSPRLLDLGQPVMIGKGARSREVKEAIVRNGAVYLAAMGGAGAVMSASVDSAGVVCWEDLGCEAVRRLHVTDMPLTVVIDSLGNDLYESGPAAYLESVERMEN